MLHELATGHLPGVAVCFLSYDLNQWIILSLNPIPNPETYFNQGLESARGRSVGDGADLDLINYAALTSPLRLSSSGFMMGISATPRASASGT